MNANDKCIMIIAAALCAGVAHFPLFGDGGYTCVYQNDFSTRTSLSPVPASRWSEATYVADTDLFVNYATKHGNANQYRSSANAQSQTNHVQDSWLKVYDQSFTNDASFRVLSNGGNQYAAFINDGTITNINFDHRTHAIHPFFNRISSGVLRMSIDIAMPAHPANTTDNINLFVGPLYEMYMGGFWQSNTFRYPGMFGANHIGNNFQAYSFGGNGAGSNSYDGAYEGSALAAGHWYRYVVDFDFDARKLSGTVYDMGTDVPTPASTSTQWCTLRQHSFYANPSAELGPVTGYIIRDVGSISGRGDNFDELLAPRVDNVKCWWRASGTSFTDADLFYENDFSKCRIRTIVPNGTSSCDYTPSTTAKTLEWYGHYPVNELSSAGLPGYQILPNNTGSGQQPIGLDGWRRLNANGRQHASIIKSSVGAGNWMIATTADSNDSNRYSIFAHPLGQTISNGSVRLSVDFRTPNKWVHSNASCRNIRIMLAPQSYYDSYNDSQQTTLYAARVGMDGSSGVNDFKFMRTGANATVTTAAGGKSNHWYRAVMTVDIDNKTYDTLIFDLGENSVAYNFPMPDASTAVFSSSGEPLRNAELPEISCFALMSMGAGGEIGGTFNEKGIIYFDNIFAWRKSASETTWHQIYYNDFNTRRYYNVPLTTCTLTDKLNRADGTDWWKSLGDGMDQLVASGNGDNPFAHRIERRIPTWNNNHFDTSHVFAAQPIGTNLTKGVVKMWADVRPPCRWTQSGGVAHVTFGADGFYRGNMYDRTFYERYFVRFGFGCGSTTTTCGLVNTVKFLISGPSGNTLLSESANATHWYRFKATTRIDRGTWDLEVFDMGTAQPTLETPTPSTSFVSRSDLPYHTTMEAGEGFSVVSLGDVFTYPDDIWKAVPLDIPLFDNIRVEHKAVSGVTIIFR